ncbi:MAG: hypothetical protein LBP81_02405, partial [Treponema sp.]|nr:hypothetical protein [Treponema sp.]
LSGVTGTSAENLAWTIPVYANDVDPGSWNAVTGTQTVTFLLSVDLKGDGNTFPIWLESSLDMTNKTGISAGSLGTASLASVNLSGTITARDGENPIPLVSISATDAEGRWIGDMYLYSPSANAPWSINIPIQQGGAVTFYVSVYDSSDAGNLILYKTFAPDAAKAVSNKPISGIALDIGDISVGRINGTVNFSDVPTPAPYWIGVTAFYHTDTDSVRINGGLSYTVTLDGANGTFTIPRDEGFLAALGDGSATSTFYYVLMQMTEDEERFIVAMKDVPINKEDLSFVELGTLSLSYSALSGTITISDGGNPIPLVVITAVTAQNFTNSVMLYSPSANAPWSINLPAQEGGAVTFHVYGYDSDWNQIFSEFLEPDAAKAVSNQPISGIALNIGDISND